MFLRDSTQSLYDPLIFIANATKIDNSTLYIKYTITKSANYRLRVTGYNVAYFLTTAVNG